MILKWVMVVLVVVLVIIRPSCSVINIHRTMSKSTNENMFCDQSSQDCDSFMKPIQKNDESFSRESMLFYSLISAGMVMLTGILPLVMISKVNDERKKDKVFLNRILSFAVGSMLGDVFLHLLPESWNPPYLDSASFHKDSMWNGIWILTGLIVFSVLEKFCSDDEEDSDDDVSETKHEKEISQEGNSNQNNNVKPLTDHNDDNNNQHMHESKDERQQRVQARGYLNLFANFTDNFTHGLAIGGSYLAGRWVGILTTLAILLHEIPHEIGDFAILLRAGFEKWQAAKYQIITASGCLLGALFALMVGSDKSDGSVAWILPFTSGGFLYIALCTIVPELTKDSPPIKESFCQLFLMLLGIGVMGAVSIIE